MWGSPSGLPSRFRAALACALPQVFFAGSRLERSVATPGRSPGGSPEGPPHMALFPLENHYCPAEVDLVPGLQARAARIAVDFLAHAVAHDPDAAFGARIAAGVPAVVEEAVF